MTQDDVSSSVDGSIATDTMDFYVGKWVKSPVYNGSTQFPGGNESQGPSDKTIPLEIGILEFTQILHNDAE